MLRKILGSTVLAMSLSFGFSQNSKQDLSIIEGTYLGVAQLQTTEVQIEESESVYHEINNFQDRHRISPVERNLYPQIDPVWQQSAQRRSIKAPVTSLLENYDGIGFTNVNPPDPCVAAGPNHVIQMINGSGGAVYKIYDKLGNALTSNLNFDNLFSGYSGLGDPIVVYDQLADRWFLSEFSNGGNKLLVAVSETNDPTLGYHTYVFQADNFPDYPKYAVWPNAYYCTANENTPSIYAFERDSMLVGASAQLIRQAVNNLPSFGFQTLTPVNFEGTNIPSTPTPASFWRHVDDEAHYPGNADPFMDYVEYWQLEPDFNNVTNSVFTGPIQIPVSEFDSDLNGYFAFAAIPQMNSNTLLDPLREVFMNRMAYRNFGNYQAMVACHVTDVDGTDRAGMRWYEFRKSDTTSWSLFQEGTFSPNADSRWMGAIQINSYGTICMAYSVSSTSMYPSLRYTGRNINDPLGTMTLPEQSIVEGSAANFSNRYGDYAAMTIDPSNDSTFWFTAEYNQSSSWSSRIAHISISAECGGLSATTNVKDATPCSGLENGQITIQGINGTTSNYLYSIDGVNYGTDSVYTNLSEGLYPIYVVNELCSVLVDSVFVSAPAILSSTYTITEPSNTSANGSILVSATGGTPPYTYNLDTDVNYQIDSLFTGISSGIYTVFTKDVKDCKYQEFVTVTPLSISETVMEKDLTIYPNPTKGMIKVTVSSKMANEGLIFSLKDMSGKEILYHESISSPSSLTKEFDLSGFPKGVYILMVKNKSTTLTTKVILE